MNFRSIAQMSDQLLSLAKRLPQDIDVFVGVPRSGLLAASILSAYRGTPFTDLEGFLEGRCFKTGLWKPGALNAEGTDGDAHRTFLDEPRRVLVLDDSVGSGTTLDRVRAEVEAAGLPHRVEYAAVYVAPDQTESVDYYGEAIHFPRVFEWNVFQKATLLPQCCLDMDGVLCHDPLHEQNDDGERYLAFLRDARPLLRPRGKLGWVVTSRLEKYREPTEDWLHRNGIRFGRLVMMDYPDRGTRMRMDTYAAHKATAYRQSEAVLFIESDIRQSVEIAQLSKREVLCIDTMQMVQPGSLPLGRPHLALEDESAPSAARQLARRVLPDPVKTGLRKGLRRIGI